MIKRKWSAAVLLCAMFAMSNAAWGTTYYLLGGTSDNPASWSTLTSNTSYSFTVDLVQYNNYVGISTSESVGDLIAISSTYTFTDASNLTYHFQYKEWGGYKYVNVDTKAAGKYTITFNGTNTYTITAAAASYTISTSGSNCTFSPTSRSIASGSSNTFTVTPASGYKLVSASVTNATCSPTDLNNATSATTITVSNPTAAGTLTVVTAAAEVASNKPVVRVGAKPTISADCGVTVNAYVAHTGCSALTGITLYYSNNRSFRTDGSYKTQSTTVTSSLPTLGNSKAITLTSANVGGVVSPGEVMYVRLSATNANGSSPYSEIVPVPFSCGKFVKQNLNKSFKACPGEHQFTWSDMFLSPTPATWSCTLGGSDATSDFTLKDGEMIWNTEGKTATSYTYTFTAKKDGYDDATATLTITYTVPGSISGSISGVTASAASTTPWTAVTLTAAGTKGNMTKIYWTSAPESAEITPSSATLSSLPATAKFKAEATGYSVDYTVTATGYTADCASSRKSVTIKVTPDVTEKCD